MELSLSCCQGLVVCLQEAETLVSAPTAHGRSLGLGSVQILRGGLVECARTARNKGDLGTFSVPPAV